jgi:oligopeptide transport system substrate-binding protein
VALAGMWKQVLGIEVNLLATEWSAFLNARQTYGFKDWTRQGYIGAYDDAGVFLEFLRSDAGPDNPSAYANPVFDALLDKADLERDAVRRAALLREAEALVLADHAVLPLYTYSLARLVNARIKGYVDNPLDVHPTRYLSLAHDPA